MKSKRIKIPFNKKCVTNQRSMSNSRKNPTNNQELLNKSNSYKIMQNTSDIDTSRNETTIESSVETIKKIIIYKKTALRPKNNLTIKENSNNDKKDNTNKNISLNNNLIRCISAKALFKKTAIKNNFKLTKNSRNKDIKDILNNSANINDINNKAYYSRLTRNFENKEENINNKTIFNKFFPSINEYRNDYKKEKIKKNNEFINIEDLLLLEEMFRSIITMNSNLSNECFEFINFYNHSSLYNKFENFFTDEISKNIVHLSILNMLFTLVLLYHYSFNDSLYKKNCECLKTIIKLNYKSFLLICEYISNKISVKEADNIWVKKLKLMIKYNLKHINKENSKEFKAFILSKRLKITPNNINNYLIEIKYYLFLIQKNINILLRNLPKSDVPQKEFYSIEAKIPNISGGEIINFFRKKVIHIKNKNGSICGNDISFYELQNFANINVKIPYLNYKTEKKFTLVLDLDETLISFKIIDNIKNINKGILRFRPGIYEFLFSVKMNYELIIFTSAKKEYADPLIDAIEKKMKYFDFRLYRDHTIIWEDEFVKDIGRLGRPMNKLIIVDNLPQNFKLQKENGIRIKPFWGEDVYDNVLHELGIILNKIAGEFYDTRKGIIKYKNDILSKVSSCFSRSEIYGK